MKKIITVLLVVALLFSMAACAGTGAKNDKFVGISMPTQDLQRWNQDGANMKEKFEAAGYQVDLQYANNEVATQVSQIENLISAGVKVLVIAAIDGMTLTQVLASAKEAGITVIAMGRYGGREVNFSSDADAILIYRPADDADDGQANAFAKKVVEDLRNILQGPTTLEPKIELDLDLRPEGKNGPLVRSYASCEEYYESWASTWERQALLRARYAAGDAELARDFLINIADPLRYPTTELTEAELQNIRKLKARMEAERLPRGVRRERHLKLGKGGLSDVEWTVQLMQLQHAGDIKDLRVNGTLEALDVLEAKKLISAIDAIQLRKAWTLCTAARNGSYLWSGRANQADILPDDIYSLGGIAVYLGYGAHRGQHFENDLLAVMRKCRDVCQRLFYGKTEGEAAAATTATASAATQQPQTAPRPRMHVIAPRLERNRRRAQR